MCLSTFIIISIILYTYKYYTMKGSLRTEAETKRRRQKERQNATDKLFARVIIARRVDGELMVAREKMGEILIRR